MSDATLRIKNLSIALEALHRTPECGDLAASVWLLLKQEVAEAEEEQTKARQWPGTSIRTSTTDTDDIPFQPLTKA